MGQDASVRILAGLDMFEDACSKLPAECTSPWFVPATEEEQWSLSRGAGDLLPSLPLPLPGPPLLI